MRIHFWGTRGSLPVATQGSVIQAKIKKALGIANGRRFDSDEALDQFIENELEFPIRQGYGGNSACVQISGGDTYMLCDMGSGLRCFGQQALAAHGSGAGQTYIFFMSHMHWDHIMGFPFFAPAYIPGNEIRIYCGHPLKGIQEAFERQQSNPTFPVHLENLSARIRFEQLQTEKWYDINGFRVKTVRQAHHGGSFAYRFEKDGKSLVYSTDGEHKLESETDSQAIIEFYQDADMVIFDAMYSLADMITIKEDWGHSSNLAGVDLCLRANVKHLCMFHHEPAYDDDMLYTVLHETRRYADIVGEDTPLKVSTAYDGLVVDL